MRYLALLVLGFVGLTACTEAAPKLDPELSKYCSRAYNQTVDALQDMATKGGVTLPAMPDRDAYVAQCVGAGFTVDQVKCLDPNWASVNDSCKATIEPKKAEAEALNKLFAEAFKAKPAEAAPAEAAPAEGAPAAAPAEAAPAAQ